MVEIEIARSVRILYKLKYVSTKDALMQLYHSLVHSYSIDGLNVRGNISKLHRLQIKPLE